MTPREALQVTRMHAGKVRDSQAPDSRPKKQACRHANRGEPGLTADLLLLKELVNLNKNIDISISFKDFCNENAEERVRFIMDKWRTYIHSSL